MGAHGSTCEHMLPPAQSTGRLRCRDRVASPDRVASDPQEYPSSSANQDFTVPATSFSPDSVHVQLMSFSAVLRASSSDLRLLTSEFAASCSFQPSKAKAFVHWLTDTSRMKHLDDPHVCHSTERMCKSVARCGKLTEA